MEKIKTIIEPPSSFFIDLKEWWQFRELFYFFTWRDIKIKYKQTYLGIIWVLLQPLTLMFLCTYVIAKNFKPHTDGIPYEILFLSGFILWNFFYTSASTASESLIQQSNIIRKIYFPRIILPVSSVLVAFFDFCITFLLFLVFCFFYKQQISWNSWWLYPVSILQVALASVGIGCFLAALNLRFRDFRYLTPFLLQFLFFATAIVYSLNAIEQPWLKYLLALNPLNGAIEIFRISFNAGFDMNIILISLLATIIYLFTGIFYFRKSEAYFADFA